MIPGLPFWSYRASQDKSHAVPANPRNVFSAYSQNWATSTKTNKMDKKKPHVFVLSFGLTGSCLHLLEVASSGGKELLSRQAEGKDWSRREEMVLSVSPHDVSVWEETPPHLFIWYAARAVYFPTSIKRKNNNWETNVRCRSTQQLDEKNK